MNRQMMGEGMSDNEPRMPDRSPEGQIFAIEAEIENMMKEYEMAARNGEDKRAQMIADRINILEVKKTNMKSMLGGSGKTMPNMGRQMMAGGGTPFPDLTGDGQVTQADILKGRGVYAQGGLAGNVGKISVEDNKMIQRAIETKPSDIGHTVQMLKNILVKKYPYIPETEINVILSKGVEDYSVRPPVPGMANGGEAIGDELEGMEMSEEQAQEELESMRPEFEQLQMLANVVKKLLAEGMSESEIVAYLKEQGLDDEDVETLFAFLQEMSGQEAVAEEQSQGIDQQIAGMM